MAGRLWRWIRGGDDLPGWALLVAPVLGTVVANADVAILLLADPVSRTERVRLALAVTLPLSLMAGAWVLWILLRFRAQVMRRTAAEREIRTALEERERTLGREVALRRELDHRVRNNLAGLAGLITLYERSGRPSAQLAQAVRGKIDAMREVHDIINRACGQAVELATLIERIAEALLPGARRGAVVWNGPRVVLSTAEASALGMIVQELVTNSLKHGALGLSDGCVVVRWTTRPDGAASTLELDWRETPVVAAGDTAGAGTGVGRPLVEGFARSDLGGDVEFAREGDSWHVHLTALLRETGAVEGETQVTHNTEVHV